MPTILPRYEAPPNFNQINSMNNAKIERNLTILQGGRKRRRRRTRRYLRGGQTQITQLPRTGNIAADNNAASAAFLTNKMDKLAEKQKIGGYRKRRFKTRKYI